MPKVPIEVKKVNLVASWNIISDPKDDVPNYNCKLCKRPLLAPPLQELQTDDFKGVVIEGKLAKGRCGDVFHEKCIQNSINSGCISCPTCNVPWQQSKILRSGTVTGVVETTMFKKKTK